MRAQQHFSTVAPAHVLVEKRRERAERWRRVAATIICEAVLALDGAADLMKIDAEYLC